MGRREPAVGHAAHRGARGWTRSPRWASTSSTCRRSTRSARRHRKGRNNTLTRRPRRPGLAVGDRLAGGRPRRGPPRPRHARRLRRLRRPGPASSAWRSRSTWRCRPRRTTRGCAEHPEWFTTRADGTIAYAENPPKKYQDIYPLNFDNDPEGIYAEVLRVVRHWIEPRRADLPGRQPAHQAAAVLGVAARRGRPRPTRTCCSSPRRSPGPPMMHALAKIGFHQSYTYFTWRNAAGELDRVPDASCPGRPPPTCGPTSSSTPRTSCTSTCSTAGRPAFKIRAVLAAMLSPDLGRLLRLRAVRERRRCGRAARSTWTRRSTSTGRATGRRRAASRPAASRRSSPGSTRSGAPTPRCTGCATYASTTSTSRSSSASPRRGRQRDPDDTVLVVVQSRPAPATRGHGLARPARPRHGLARLGSSSPTS